MAAVEADPCDWWYWDGTRQLQCGEAGEVTSDRVLCEKHRDELERQRQSERATKVDT